MLAGRLLCSIGEAGGAGRAAERGQARCVCRAQHGLPGVAVLLDPAVT